MWCTYGSTWFYLWKSGKSSLCWCFKYVFSYLYLFELWLFFELLIHLSLCTLALIPVYPSKNVWVETVYVMCKCALAASSFFHHHLIRTTFQCWISTFIPKDLVTESFTLCAMFDNIESTYLEFMIWIALRLILANIFWTESYPYASRYVFMHQCFTHSQTNSFEWLWMQSRYFSK